MTLTKILLPTLLIGLTGIQTAHASRREPSTKGPLTCFEQVKTKTTINGIFKLNITQVVMAELCDVDLREADREEIGDCEKKIRKSLDTQDGTLSKLIQKVPELQKQSSLSGKTNTDKVMDFLFSREVMPMTINDSEEGTYGSEDSYITFDDAYTKLNLYEISQEYLPKHLRQDGNMVWTIDGKYYEQGYTIGTGWKHHLGNSQQKAFQAVSPDLHSIYLSEYIGESTVILPQPSTFTINDAIFNGKLPRFQIFVDTSKGTPMLYMNQWLVDANSITLVDQKSYPLNQRNEATYEADILKGRGYLSAVYSFGCK